MGCKHCGGKRIDKRAVCRTCYNYLKYLQDASKYSEDLVNRAKLYWEAVDPSYETTILGRSNRRYLEYTDDELLNMSTENWRKVLQFLVSQKSIHTSEIAALKKRRDDIRMDNDIFD